MVLGGYKLKTNYKSGKRYFIKIVNKKIFFFHSFKFLLINKLKKKK